jgi:hypothetical protein
MTFRSPLRNEWERYEPQMKLQAGAPGYDGAVARLMLDFMPVMVAAFERERDKATPPKIMLSALTGVLINLAEQTIKANVSEGAQRDALAILLMRIDEDVRRRLAERGKHGSILLPGLGG